jgi:hypothetical protein
MSMFRTRGGKRAQASQPVQPSTKKQPEPELRAGAGPGNADAAALQQASIRLKASEQVEARHHHQKQHIIPPTNMAASCIFCKIIKGRSAV